MSNHTENLRALGDDQGDYTVIGQSLIGAAETIDELSEEIRGLRRELKIHNDKSTDEYWIWQGDGDDHPESLACPVLISANDLRELISSPDKGVYGGGGPYLMTWGTGEEMDAHLLALRFDNAMKGI